MRHPYMCLPRGRSSGMGSMDGIWMDGYGMDGWMRC